MLLEALPGLLPRSRKVLTAACLDGNREEPWPVLWHLSPQGKGYRRAHKAVSALLTTSRGDGLPCNAAKREGKTAREGAAKGKQGEKGLEVR